MGRESSHKTEKGSGRLLHYALSVLSGAMMGFSFPPSQLGILAIFGLVPILIVMSDFQRIKPALRYIYISMMVFHLITLNWTGGYAHGNDIYMMIAGGVTMLVHPFFYFLPFGAYLYIKKYLGEGIALSSFPFVWIAYEYSHSLSEWSFPWITIGNSQTYDISAIQYISFTGVYGISFWILILNAIAFVLYSGLANGRFKPLSWKSFVLLGIFAAVFFAPRWYGADVHAKAQEEIQLPTITVGIIQPNIDPWEKWRRNGFDVARTYLEKTRELLRDKSVRPDVVLWPETAIPEFLLLPSRQNLLDTIRNELDRLDVSVLTGVQHAVYYEDSTLAPPSAKRSITGQRYDVFNAAAFVQPGTSEIPWYGKMKMVPIAERVPYADAFYFMDFLRWGVGVGGWQIGPGQVLFTEKRTGTKFATLICYESTYPGFVASFVRKGAEFISIITIDSWWGRMSGAFQHQRYAVLRAIENRRWIARCALGGISGFIDPRGYEYDNTELFSQAILQRTIERRTDLSWYSEHGDVFAQLLSFIGLIVVLIAVSIKVSQAYRGKFYALD